MTNQQAAQDVGGMPEPVDIPETVMHGPIEVSMTVHCMTQDGSSGRLTFHLPAGRFPATEEMQDILDAALENDGSIPAGTRLMTKPEFWDHITKREAGMALPMSGDREFQAPGYNVPKNLLIDAILGAGGKVGQWNRANLEEMTLDQLAAIYNGI